MDPSVVLPFLTSVVSFVFAILVFDQWRSRRRAYQLAWTVGLTWYGIAAGAEFVGSAFGWNEGLYRAWYIFGALGVASWLGLGTIFLLNRTRFGYFVAVALAAGGLLSLLAAAARGREGEPVGAPTVAVVVGAAIAAAIVLGAVTAIRRSNVAPTAAGMLVVAFGASALATLVAPLDPPGFAVDAESGVPAATALPSYLRIVSPPFNVTGAAALVFGALYSAYIFMPKRRLVRVRSRVPVVSNVARALAVVVNFLASIPGAFRAWRAGELHSRVPATLLIAIGAFIPSLTDGLTRFGITWGFFLGQLLGVVLIFAGFLASVEVFTDVRIPFTAVVVGRRRAGVEGTDGGRV